MLTVNLGPMSLPVSQLLLLLALIVALVVGVIAGRRYQIRVTGSLSDVFLVAVLSARVGFVLLYFDEYRDSLWGVVDIRDGGFSVPAGIAGALFMTAFLFWRQPRLRRPLGMAVTAGLIGWGAVTFAVGLVEHQNRDLPELAFQDLTGTEQPIAAIAPGKPKVVNLWASWCPPCIREMPVLEAAQRRYPEVAFVFINQGEAPATIQQFLLSQELDLHHVLHDPEGRMGQVAGSRALPTTLFYDADGRQVDAHLGELSRASLARRLENFESP